MLIIVSFLILAAAAAFMVPMTQAGMRKLYDPLVRRLTAGDPGCRVEQPAATTLVLSLQTDAGTTVFLLRQTLSQLHVRWTNESPVTGRHEARWSFFKFSSQQRMKDRIYDDLLDIHRTMMRS